MECPAQSPDLNPIEEGFSYIKAWIYAHFHLILAQFQGDNWCDLIGVLWKAVIKSMTPDHIWGWFSDCGYLAHH